jgi:hypothetical protein
LRLASAGPSGARDAGEPDTHQRGSHFNRIPVAMTTALVDDSGIE